MFIVIYDKVNIIVYDEIQVTFTMTTCNRLDLTIKTLNSLKKFEYFNKLSRIILMIDCFNETFADTLHNLYNEDSIHFVTPISKTKTNKNLRHMENLEQLFNMVTTRWWFHCEDDWEFTSPGFIEDSIELLTDGSKDKTIYMTNGRKPNSFKPRVNQTFGWRKTTVNNLSYSTLNINSGPAGKFTSYTANPSIIDTRVARTLIGNFSNYKGEYDVSRVLGKRYSARVGIFSRPYYHHIGNGRSVMN